MPEARFTLPEGLLGLFPEGDVDSQNCNLYYLILVKNGGHGDIQVEISSDVFKPPRAAGRDHLLENLEPFLADLGGDQGKRIGSDDLFQAFIEPLGRHLAGRQNHPPGIQQKQRLRVGLDEGPQGGFPLPQGFLSLFVGGNIFVDPQDAKNLAVGHVQRDFAGLQPDLGASRGGLRLDNIHFGAQGFHDLAVIHSVEVGLFPPAHGKVVLAQKLLRLIEAGIASEQGITAQIAKITILPENPDGYRFYNQLQTTVDHAF